MIPRGSTPSKASVSGKAQGSRTIRAMRPLTRRLFFPVVILVIAGFLTWNGRHRRATEMAAMEAFASQVVSGGAAGATEPVLEQAVRRRLADRRAYTLEVREGDGGPAPDGAASHVVMVRVDGLAFLGLRCRYDSDPDRMAIVGMFEPGAGAVE